MYVGTKQKNACRSSRRLNKSHYGVHGSCQPPVESVQEARDPASTLVFRILEGHSYEMVGNPGGVCILQRLWKAARAHSSSRRSTRCPEMSGGGRSWRSHDYDDSPSPTHEIKECNGSGLRLEPHRVTAFVRPDRALLCARSMGSWRAPSSPFSRCGEEAICQVTTLKPTAAGRPTSTGAPSSKV